MTGELVTKELTRLETHASPVDKPPCKCPKNGVSRAVCGKSLKPKLKRCPCVCHSAAVQGPVKPSKPVVHEGGPYSRACARCKAPVGEWCTTPSKLPHQERLYEVVPTHIARQLAYTHRAGDRTARRFKKTA